MTERASDFPAYLEWANVGSCLRLDDDLRDQVVVIVFWSSSCIHSLHLLRALEELESSWIHRPVAILGAHVGRYPVESPAAAVRAAVARLAVPFPVVIDTERVMWSAYECEAWPTLVLVDHAGQIRYHGSGEVDADRLGAAVHALADEAETVGAVRAALPLDLEATVTPGELAYPTKLTVDPESGWLWIADSGHHRLVAVEPERGGIQAIVGNGRPGFRDGTFARAAFFAPQGVCVRDGMLFVADSGNHAIRRVDLRAGEVTTLVGTGELTHDRGGALGRSQGLASPWDVCADGDELLVAMAGGHGLWRVDLDTARAAPDPFALAQPMGVAIETAGTCVVAESGRNVVARVARGAAQSEVVVGQGAFEFGDADGPLPEARLQHPRGIAVDASGVLWIADTLNDAVRRCDGSRLETVPIGSYVLDRPEGITATAQRIFVADTGAHRVLAFDPASGSSDEVVVQ